MASLKQGAEVVHVLDYCEPPLWVPGPAQHPYRLIESYRKCALQKAFKGLSGRVLDFGCGYKPYEALLRREGIQDWYGIDLRVRTTGESAGSRADAFWDGEVLPLENSSFDIVLTTQVLEHVENLDGTLAELARVLKPGGLMIATVPMTGVLHEEPYDFRRFTPYGFGRKVAKHGFELLTSVALGGVTATAGTLVAGHVNFLKKVPLAGGALFKLSVAGITHSAGLLERTMFRAGLKQAKITADFLFISRKI